MVKSLCKLFSNILMEEEQFFKGPVYILCIFNVLCRSCLIQKIVNR